MGRGGTTENNLLYGERQERNSNSLVEQDFNQQLDHNAQTIYQLANTESVLIGKETVSDEQLKNYLQQPHLITNSKDHLLVTGHHNNYNFYGGKRGDVDNYDWLAIQTENKKAGFKLKRKAKKLVKGNSVVIADKTIEKEEEVIGDILDRQLPYLNSIAMHSEINDHKVVFSRLENDPNPHRMLVHAPKSNLENLNNSYSSINNEKQFIDLRALAAVEIVSENYKDDDLVWMRVNDDYLICCRKAGSLGETFKRIANNKIYECIGLVPLKKYSAF
jgi:hypothetical protein